MEVAIAFILIIVFFVYLIQIVNLDFNDPNSIKWAIIYTGILSILCSSEVLGILVIVFGLVIGLVIGGKK